MSDKDADDLAQEIFKHNLKASQSTRQLFTELSQGQAEDAVIEEFNRLMGAIEDEQQAEDAAMLMQRLAQGLQSERLANAVMEEADQNPLLVVDEEPPQ